MKYRSLLFFLCFLAFSKEFDLFGQGFSEQNKKIEEVEYYTFEYQITSSKTRKDSIDILKKKIPELLQDSTQSTLIYLKLSALYHQNNDYANSLKYSLNATKTSKNIGNDTLRVRAFMQSTKTYLQLRDTELAWKTLEKTQGFFRKFEGSDLLAELYLLFAELYSMMEEYDAATSYINLSLKQSQVSQSEYWQAKAFLMSGKLLKERKQYEKALKDLKKAYKFFKRKQLSPDFLEVSITLAQAYQGLKNFRKASIYLKEVYPIAEKFGLTVALMETYEMLAYGAEQEQKTDSALYYYKKFKIYHDSVFTRQKHQSIIHIQSLYDLEEKDEKIKSQDKEVKQKAKTRNLSIAVLILVSVLLYVLYRKNKQQIRSNTQLEEKNAKISAQKSEVMQQKEHIEARTRLLSIKNIQIEKRSKNIISSLNYAQRIQKAMLPSLPQILKLLPNAFILFKPRDIVSGDFYWITKRNHQIVLVVADCTGHGVPGAIMSVIGNNLFHEIVTVKGITEADQVLNELHSGIRRILKQDETRNRDGMDVAVCVIDDYPEEYEEILGERKIQFAGAHNPLIYFQESQELHLIKGDRYAIGGYLSEQVQDFTKHTILLNKSTTFYIFSDGYQDQFGKGNRKFGKKRLRELFMEIHQEPMETQKHKMEQKIEDWRQGHKQMDDMLIIGVRVHK